MKQKQVLLSEEEFFNLIKRMVNEVKEEETFDMDFETSEIEDEDDVIELISDFFKEEVLGDLSPREINMLKREVRKSDVNENEKRNLGSRLRSFRDNAMMVGGSLMAGVGAVSALGEFTGWSEFEMTQKIHDFIREAGVGNYTGPITVSMVAAGLTMALRGLANKYNRKEM